MEARRVGDHAPGGGGAPRPDQAGTHPDGQDGHPPGGGQPRRRLRAVRNYGRSLSYTGLVFGWIALVVSLTPSLLPRSWQVQGFVSGSALAQGYGVGVFASWAARRARVPRPGQQARQQAWYALATLAVITIPLMIIISSRWQSRIRDAVGAPATSPAQYLGVFAIAAGLAIGVIGVARLIHDGYAISADRMRRYLPVTAARLAAIGIVGLLTFGLATGFSDQVLMRGVNRVFSAANDGDVPGVSRPLSPLRSGGPSSLVTWESLGMEGRAFVSAGPTAGEIERFTGRSAVPPIRVYVGLDSASTLQEQADLALAELKRTGAFQRALLAVAMPTGRGSVYSTLADPLEYMYGGNTAIVSMQYSYLPSWISFLAQRPQAGQAGRDLFDTIYRYWAHLPAGHRPRLVVFGESLGAYGVSAAFPSIADLTARTDGALFVGPPHETRVWRELTDARVPGSPEWLPVYGDGGTVRFVSSAGDLRLPGGGLRHPEVVYVQHASDPVVWWSWSLFWHKPDWLAEARGPGVASAMQWYPFVTFWQISADLIVRGTTPGYGHYYGPEIPTAWAAILHPPGWTDAQTAKLTSAAAHGTLP